jgi:hypothetical protein
MHIIVRDVYNPTKDAKIGIRVMRVKTTKINLWPKKPHRMPGAEHRVRAYVWIMRGNVNVTPLSRSARRIRGSSYPCVRSMMNVRVLKIRVIA